jgi:hypothetical protein
MPVTETFSHVTWNTHISIAGQFVEWYTTVEVVHRIWRISFRTIFLNLGNNKYVTYFDVHFPFGLTYFSAVL